MPERPADKLTKAVEAVVRRTEATREAAKLAAAERAKRDREAGQQRIGGMR